MSQPRDREPAAEDADPTGVRALLSSLPDPGPMPADLAERITARLRQEQEQRATGEVAGATVTPLGGRRPGRSPHHWLAAAAAVAAVAVAGTVVVQSALGDRAWDSVAAFYTGDTRDEAASADDGAAARSSGSESGGSESAESAVGGSGEELAGEGDSSPQALGAVTVMPGEVALSAETFAVGAAAAVESVTGPSVDAQEESVPSLTPEQAQACVRATGSDPADGSWVVGRAAVDGEPAVLVVASGQSTPTAWAVAAGCTGGDPAAETLHGPVPLP